MLASVLRLETLLKCSLCGNLLRSTRTLNECGHCFCENCIYDRLGEERQCPKCHIPAIVKNLRKDPLHDTLIACVKKLKQCMVETDPASLSVPPFDSTINNNDTQSQQQRASPSLSASSQTDEDKLKNDITTDHHHRSPDPPPLDKSDHQYSQQLQNTYDSDATTLSSQAILTMPEEPYQTDDNNRRSAPPPPPPPSRPKLPIVHSTDDLLLAMEDEDVNEAPTTPVSTKKIQSNTNRINTATNSSPTIPKQQDDQLYSCSDDLLAAMESEEIVMDEDDDDDDDDENNRTFASTRPPLFKKPSCQQYTPPSKSIRRRLSSHTSAEDQEPTTKHQKTTATTNDNDDSYFVAPLPPTMNGDNSSSSSSSSSSDQSLRWRCTSCFYGGNEPTHLVCGVCRKEQPKDIPMLPSTTTMMNEVTPTVPLTLDLSSSSSSGFVVPSTFANEHVQHPPPPVHETAVRVMFTSLTADDDEKLDVAMTMAIDTSLKMEIYSDTRDVGNVTHLITSVNHQGLCTRTIKYLLCIITGKWIVDTSWLTESVQAGYWLPEEKYQVVGDKTSGVTHGPARGRQRRQQNMMDGDGDDDDDTTIQFFGADDVRFFFYGDFPDHDTKVKLLQLVKKGGGKVISRRPPLDQLEQDDLVIIVSSLDDMLGSRKKAHAWLKSCAHVKDFQWLLDSIARSNWVLE